LVDIAATDSRRQLFLERRCSSRRIACTESVNRCGTRVLSSLRLFLCLVAAIQRRKCR
jgi:hypothetical protein